ncbi:MAG: D-alanyl-D-alanine carboxypeptidase/D-alanyl-D-alanine-endopeptidase [Phycisphaerales bacterium JB063]
MRRDGWMKRWQPVLAGAMLLWAGLAMGDVDAQIENYLGVADLRGTVVSVCVVDVGRDEVLAEVEENRSMIPASNMKIITTATALATLGPDFRFSTRLSLLEDEDGGLPSLLIVGDGDPAFGDPATLASAGYTVDDLMGWWLDAIEATGQTEFERIVLDDRVFEHGADERVHPTWPKNQLHKWYCAQVMGINFFNNVFQVQATPTQMGDDVELAIYPYGPFVRTDLRVQTGRIDQWDIITSADNNHITFRGQLRHPQQQRVAMHDPADVLGQLLKRELGRRGITVGEVVRPAADELLPEGRLLHQINTTLQAVLNRTNRDSMNLYAEALLKRSGFQLTGVPGSFDNGSAAVRRFLANHLDDPTLAASIHVADGSGMSRDNRVTTRALAELLAGMPATASFGPVLESLARPGQGGTLDSRFSDTDLAGEVYAKSGYLNGVSALSGYLVYPPLRAGGSPRYIAFSIVCNGFGSGNARELSNRDMKRLQEEIVALIDAEVALAAPRG